MKALKTLCFGVCLFSMVPTVLGQNNDPQMDSMERYLKDFFRGDSFKIMRERMNDLIKEMDKDFQSLDSLLQDEKLNQFLRGSDLFSGMSDGEHEWLETKDQRILVLKIEGQEDSPLTINIEDGQVKVKGRIEKETIQETSMGTSRSVTIREINTSYLVPEDCDPESVEIENKDGEILVKFSKTGRDERTPVKESEDHKTI